MPRWCCSGRTARSPTPRSRWAFAISIASRRCFASASVISPAKFARRSPRGSFDVEIEAAVVVAQPADAGALDGAHRPLEHALGRAGDEAAFEVAEHATHGM